jgi:hypothetical protein
LKKLLILILFPLLFACSDNSDEVNRFLPDVPVNKTIFLSNPEFINLQVVGGWAYTQGGISGIIIYHAGINNYLAFERSAPHRTPEPCSVMTVKNSLTMVCSCDDTVFNLLNGAPMTDGIIYPALQYRVIPNGPNLQITNF